jgi:hypothetical protein
MWGRRPGEISSVPSSTFTTFRFPYAGGFFGTAFPDSSSLPRPSSQYDGLGTLLSSCTWLSLRRCRIHFMLRTVVSRVLLELFSSLRHIRSPDASEDSYPTLWRLSGLDFHQLANDSFRTDLNAVYVKQHRAMSTGKILDRGLKIYMSSVGAIHESPALLRWAIRELPLQKLFFQAIQKHS